MNMSLLGIRETLELMARSDVEQERKDAIRKILNFKHEVRGTTLYVYLTILEIQHFDIFTEELARRKIPVTYDNVILVVPYALSKKVGTFYGRPVIFEIGEEKCNEKEEKKEEHTKER